MNGRCGIVMVHADKCTKKRCPTDTEFKRDWTPKRQCNAIDVSWLKTVDLR
jgi:hypothetical protein